MEIPRPVRRSCVAVALIAVIACFHAESASAQPQANAANAALSVNGTGRVDQNGAALFMNSRVLPTPAGSAPLYHHATTPSTSIEFRIQGPVGAPIALAVGALNPSPTPIAGYWFELSFQSYQLLVNAADPSNLVNLGAFIGASGSWTFVLPQGVPPTFGTAHLQALLIDPAAAPPLFVRFTGTVTVGVQNDIPTLAKNVADAYTQADDNPLYLLSLCSTGFKSGGATAGAFLGQAAYEVGSGSPDATTSIVYNGIGPNTTIAAAPPAGPPAMGQSATLFIDYTSQGGPACPGLPASGERGLNYDLQVVAQLGAWKLHGDQRDVSACTELSYSANGAPVTLLNPQGLGVYLNINVEDEFGLHGGISAVTVTGPQLAVINPSGQATTPSIGVAMLQSDSGGGNGESEWYLQVQLAASGTSRMPLVEDASGPRDVYSVMVTWNDSTTSGPYMLVLRGTIDPDLNPAQVLTAMPSTVNQPAPASLLNPGTFSAAIVLTFSTGTLQSPSLHSHISIEAEQNGTVFEFDDMQIGFTASTQTLTLCTPNFVTGSQVTLIISRSDIQCAEYYAQNVVFTP